MSSSVSVFEISENLIEQEVRRLGYHLIAGVDEAGRGPLAGPVVVAACILPPGFCLDGLNDSKKLTPAKRDKLFEKLTADHRVIYSISIISAQIIDEINIFQATLKGMREAVAGLQTAPDYVLVDGSHTPQFTCPSKAIVKGDARCLSIAAASIIAKVTRDRLMHQIHSEYPVYQFAKHMGYGTKVHMEAIAQHGPTPHHRKTFEPLKSLFFSNQKENTND